MENVFLRCHPRTKIGVEVIWNPVPTSSLSGDCYTDGWLSSVLDRLELLGYGAIPCGRWVLARHLLFSQRWGWIVKGLWFNQHDLIRQDAFNSWNISISLPLCISKYYQASGFMGWLLNIYFVPIVSWKEVCHHTRLQVIDLHGSLSFLCVGALGFQIGAGCIWPNTLLPTLHPRWFGQMVFQYKEKISNGMRDAWGHSQTCSHWPQVLSIISTLKAGCSLLLILPPSSGPIFPQGWRRGGFTQCASNCAKSIYY